MTFSIQVPCLPVLTHILLTEDIYSPLSLLSYKGFFYSKLAEYSFRACLFTAGEGRGAIWQRIKININLHSLQKKKNVI